jgi:hypothetical protein
MQSCVSCDAVSAELVASIFRMKEVTNSLALPELPPLPYRLLFCLALLFHREDGGDMFLRNVKFFSEL